MLIPSFDDSGALPVPPSGGGGRPDEAELEENPFAGGTDGHATGGSGGWFADDGRR